MAYLRDNKNKPHLPVLSSSFKDFTLAGFLRSAVSMVCSMLGGDIISSISSLVSLEFFLGRCCMLLLTVRET